MDRKDYQKFLAESVVQLLGRIRIVDTPRGGAPEDIRKKWIGVEMPCLFKGVSGPLREIATDKTITPYSSYTVGQVDAIRALATVSPQAAQYWNHIGFPSSEGALFAFNAECAIEIISVKTEDELFAAFDELMARLQANVK